MTLLGALAAWKPFTALVVGDFMLDQLVYGNAERLSPEAPVPVLHVRRSEARAGGAGNVCLDLVAMRARVLAFGVTGADESGGKLRAALAAEGVDAGGLVVDAARPTTVKQSLIGLAQHRHPQKMFRVDHESREPLGEGVVRALLERFGAALAGADVVCIEDYGKGVCTPELCRGVIELCRARGVEVLVDPAAIEDYSKYRGATAITPNRTEAALAAGLSAHATAGKAAHEHDGIARRMLEDLGLDAAVVTLDKDGVLLLERGAASDNPQHVPTHPREVYDVTGAGDMVLAALAAARANGIGWADACRLANAAAGLEVEVFGVVPMPIERIHREVMLRERGGGGSGGGWGRGKVMTLEELRVEVAAQRRDGRTIVFTNGCFDVLHAGHLSLLHRASELGASELGASELGSADIRERADAGLNGHSPASDGVRRSTSEARGFLVVAINSDDSVRRLKGAKDPARPINTQQDRAELLAGLACVDAVTIFEDDTPERLIRAVAPDVLVKGAEYSGTAVPGAEFVEQRGGRVVLLEMVAGKSTTGTVAKMRGR